MATAPPPAAPAVSQDTHRLEYDQFIEQQIRRTRATVKLVDLVSRIMTAVAGLVAILLTAALVEHWLVPGGLSTFWRSVLWLGLVAAGAWFVWRQIAPLLVQRINSVYAAQAIESHSPGLKNSLLNLLLFRQHRELVPDAVYRTVEEQAATRLATADINAAVDRSGLIRIGYVLLAIVVLAGLYKVISPKDPVATAGRVLMPWADIPVPTRVSILEVEPGPIRVARGETVEVSAAVAGLAEDETVVLRYSTEDGQTVDYPVEMLRPEGEYRYRATLPADPPAGAAPGVQQPMTYFIEAGDARSKEFAIAVVDAPTIVLEQIEYDFPDYTQRADRIQPDDGRIRALEGTRVTVRAQTNHPVRKAGIDLGAEGQIDVPLTPVEGNARRVAGEFVLELDPETRTQPHDLYTLRFTDAAGQRNRKPVHYRLEFIPDLRPEVEILQPEATEMEVRLGETVSIEVEARDPDYGLSRVTLFGRTEKGMTFEQPLLEGEHEGRFRTRHPFTPQDPDFAVGDVVECWVEVEDNRTPEPNRAVTDRRQFKITEPPPVEDHPALAEQGQGGPQQQQQQPQQQGQENAADQQPQEGEEQPDGNGGQQGQQQRQQKGEAGQQDGGGAAQQQEPQQQQDGAGEGAPPDQQPQDGQREGQQQQGDGAAQQQTQQQNGQNGAGGEPQPGGGEQGDPQQAAEGADGQTPTAEGTQNGDPATQQPGGAGQQRAPDGQSAQQPSADQGEQPGEGGQEASGGGESQPVPPDGSDDRTAFQRMMDHFKDQQNGGGEQPQEPQQGEPPADQERQQSPQPGDPDRPPEGDAARQGGEPQQGEAQQEPGRQSPEEQPAQAAESRGQEERSPDGEAAGEPEQQEGQSAEGQRPEQSGDPTGAQDQRQGQREANDGTEQPTSAQDQQQPTGDAQRQQPGETPPESAGEDRGAGEAGANGSEQQEQPADQGGDPSQASRPNESQGPSGAGEPSGTDKAAPDPSQQAQPSEKRPQEGSGSEQQEGQEPASPSQSKHESDSQGEQGGDRSGGGTTGGGQEAPREGTGSPGQNESADEGEGSSGEKGEGDTSTGEGADREAGQQTGQSGENAGRGSEQRSGQGDQPGGAEGDGGEPDSGDPSDRPPQADQQERTQDGRAPQQQGQPGQQPEQPQDGRQEDGRQPGSAAGNPATGGGDPGNALPPPAANGNAGPVGDEANLDYARKQTELVLDRLENQLKEREVDPELLDKLGWSEDDLKKFVDRWKSLKQSAQSDGEAATGAKQELDRALRSLGLSRREVRRGSGNIPVDELRDLRDAPRVPVPAEFQDEMQAYTRGISEQE